jgi:hypothetical protein
MTLQPPNSSFNRLLKRSTAVLSLYLAASWGAMGITSLPREFLSIIVDFHIKLTDFF